ncbi:MAG: fused MFS/spermidine synthase [Actinomycetota bacterium]
MTKRAAQVLVFVTSGAVLVLEILAGRLLAPFVGVSLETFTGIIGTMLAGIAVGAALGGRLADRRDPAAMIGPTLIAGGVLSWLSIPIVAWIGPGIGQDIPAIVTLALFGFFAPAMVLSAIGPMVAKLRLQSLDETGEVVGGLSAAGTAGALFGTFFTGFVLVAAAPTRPIILALGAGLALWGLVQTVRQAGEWPTVGVGILAAGALGLAATAPDQCQRESAYACVSIITDAEDESLRYLIMDTLRHGAVDLDDPTHLELGYVQVIGAVIDTMPAGPIDALHVGGGAFSLPTYIAASRPGSTNLVLEIDPLLIDVAEEQLGLVTGPDLVIRTGDARLALADLPDDAYDVVVGDAFGGRAVPWHLTTTEFIAELARVLRPGGVYVMNTIDGNENRFVEAELATLAEHFDHRAVVVPEDWPRPGPANQLLLASGRPVPSIPLDPADWYLIDDVVEFTGNGIILRDDYAPVEQLGTNF